MGLIKQLIPNEKDNFSFLGNNASFNSTFNYLTSNGTGGIKYNKDIKIENEVSFSIWFKMNNSKGTHLIDMRTSDTWGYQPIYITDSKIQYHRRYDENSGVSFEFSNSFETGKWYHICIRAKNEAGKIECWLNGQKLSGTFTDNPLPMQGEFPLYIGSRHSNRNDYYIDGQIKDVRIYNHWVSDYEIKELSKGLCCHYSFDDASNLLINAEKYTKNSPLVREDSKKDGYATQDMYCEVIPGATYTFQFKTDGVYSPSHHGANGANPLNRYCAVWFYLIKEYDPSNTGYDTPVFLSTSYDSNFKCRYINYTIPEGFHGLRIRTNTYSDDATPLTINFWDFKLTLGDKLTPWTPYNSVYKINDNSGFNNNSTKVNNVIGVTSSKIGPGAGLFNGADSYVALPTSCKINPPFTYNIWAYMDDWSDYGNDGQRIISCTEGGGFNLEAPSNTIHFAFHNGATPDGYGYNLKTSVTVDSLGESNWHMFTFSINNQEAVGYIDGVEVARNSYTGTLTYNSLNTIYIGAEAGGDDEGSALSCYFNGKIDDFRLYSSILSPEDIKDLYNCRCAIDNKHNMKASSYKEENSTFNVNPNGIVGCTNFVENEYLYMEDGAKFLKIFEHDIRKDPEFFKDEDEAKKFVGKNRFSRLIDLSDSSFKSTENKYEFILRYPDASYTAPVTFSGTENKEYTIGNIYDITNKLSEGQYTVDDLPDIECDGITFKTYLRLNLSTSLLNSSAVATLYINTPRGTISSATATIIEGTGGGRPFKDLNDAYLTFIISENNEFYIEIGGSNDSVNGILRDGDGNNITLKFIKHANGDLFLQDSIRMNYLVGSNSNFSYYNRWKQESDPNTSLKNADQCEPIYLSMTKQWNGKGLGLSESDGKGGPTYLECQSGSDYWFGAIGQIDSSWNGGKFPAPDGNPYQHVQLWVRVDNTNYNKSGNSISKSIVNQYMKFDNSTPAINTGVTLTSNSKVSVSFKCNSDMNRGCIVFGQGALGQLNNTFEMYVWQLGSVQQIQLNMGKENTTQGISNFTANTVYNVDVYGDGRYAINGVEGNIGRTCGSDTLANTCLIGAIHRKQSGSDSYTEYKTITDGVVTQIDKFEIWEKDGNGNYSILKYRYYSPQRICTADNFIED